MRVKIENGGERKTAGGCANEDGLKPLCPFCDGLGLPAEKERDARRMVNLI